MTERKTETIALFGCGVQGSIIAKGIATGMTEGYTLAGVYDISPEATAALAAECGCAACGSLAELLALSPDYVIEATCIPALREVIVQILEAGCNLIPLSIGVLAESDIYEAVCRAAREHGVQVLLPSGAVGGFDIMDAAELCGGLKVSMTTEKPPRSLHKAPSLKGRVLSETEPETLFSGSAAQAIRSFPQNVNVAVAVSLATIGPDNLMIQIKSDPKLASACHTINLEGDFGSAAISIRPKPSANPSSSMVAAYSILSLLRRRKAPIVV